MAVVNLLQLLQGLQAGQQSGHRPQRAGGGVSPVESRQGSPVQPAPQPVSPNYQFGPHQFGPAATNPNLNAYNPSSAFGPLQRPGDQGMVGMGSGVGYDGLTDIARWNDQLAAQTDAENARLEADNAAKLQRQLESQRQAVEERKKRQQEHLNWLNSPASEAYRYSIQKEDWERRHPGKRYEDY